MARGHDVLGIDAKLDDMWAGMNYAERYADQGKEAEVVIPELIAETENVALGGLQSAIPEGRFNLW
jgi:hypothetical protein